MAISNYNAAATIFEDIPHTFVALQKLVMAMEDYCKAKNKRIFWGKDKGLKAYQKFEKCLKDTLDSMIIDGCISHSTEISECRDNILQLIKIFSQCFPNWHKAYNFAYEYFYINSEIAESHIANLL
ncbi:hypothetical protein [Maridesulfovibrio bastinii]|uniref:hypothetical protein n=1 Tax=Maridesulfovibrio bastinii TaxID=47157 RepID=UPI000485D2E6|nr:hypothetical protein [Maridesulfovibrio bastinii]